MEKYVTFVKDEEESRKVQEALFRAGFKWGYDKVAYVQLTEMPFLYVEDGRVTCGGTFTFAFNKNYSPINADEIISDPFQLDGATKPEEMIDIDGKSWSVSTIKEALRNHID